MFFETNYTIAAVKPAAICTNNNIIHSHTNSTSFVSSVKIQLE